MLIFDINVAENTVMHDITCFYFIQIMCRIQVLFNISRSPMSPLQKTLIFNHVKVLYDQSITKFHQHLFSEVRYIIHFIPKDHLLIH